jgi:hypothetical protein
VRAMKASRTYLLCERLETSLTPTARGKRRCVGVPVHDHSQRHRVAPTEGNDALEAGLNTAEYPTMTSTCCLGDPNTGVVLERAEDPPRIEMQRNGKRPTQRVGKAARDGPCEGVTNVRGERVRPFLKQGWGTASQPQLRRWGIRQHFLGTPLFYERRSDLSTRTANNICWFVH